MQQRSLGFWMLTALVTGNMIGSGIFLLPASLGSFGTIGLVAWVFTALGAVVLGLVFAKLGSILPKVGGPYAYCREAFGDFAGFQIAYNYWIALWVGNAAIVVALVGYLSIFFPILADERYLAFAVSAGIVWLLTWINILGVRQAGILQLLTTIIKILPLVALVGIGLFYLRPENFLAFNVSGKSHFAAFSGAASLTLWSFIGLESATVPAEEVENPQRDIPRATIIGILLAAIVYIASAVVVMGIVPLQDLVHSSAPYAMAANIIFGSWGGYAIAAGAAVSCFGALNGWTLLQGRIPYAAAKDNLFPPIFARESSTGTPVVGLVVSSSCITLLLLLTVHEQLVQQFTFIILLAVMATLIPYLMTSMAMLVIFLRDRIPGNFNKKRVFGVIAVLAFLYSFWTLVGAGRDIIFYGALLFFTSVPVYVWNVYHRHESTHAA